MKQALVVGSTHRFEVVLAKDGEDWDLDAATVVLAIRKPDGSGGFSDTTVNATVDGNLAYYVCSTTFLDVPGVWSRSWRVTDGAIVGKTPRVVFEVDAA
jgi:hypothetical protein